MLDIEFLEMDEVVSKGLEFMSENAQSLLVQIKNFDGVSEKTFKHYDKEGVLLDESNEIYDDSRMTFYHSLMSSLDSVYETRKGLKKGDQNYWNYCSIIIDRSGDNKIIFNYSEQLEIERDQRLLDSLGKDLYEKYKNEREKGVETSVASTEPVSDKRTSSTEMSIDQLLGAIYQDLVNNMPEKWINFQVESEIFQKDGQEVVSNYFRYQTESGEKQKEFTPENIFLPGNAMKKIQQKMKEEENDGWRKALFTFNVDKSVNIEVLEK